jgi:uncharacterized protein YegL
MSGDPIEAVKNGMQVLIGSLRQDPQALETAYLSVITFDTEAKQVVPLTDLISFQEPYLSAQGVTSLGEGLKLLAKCIDNEVAKSTPEQKGDWKPLVFIMTDGAPTDDWEAGLREFQKRKTGIVVACAAGAGADTSVLKKVTESVVALDTADTGTIKAFFKWISSTVSASSKKVDTWGEEVNTLKELPSPPAEVNIVI